MKCYRIGLRLVLPLSALAMAGCGGGGGGGGATADAWQASAVGFEGGNVLSVATDGAATLFVGTANNGLFRSVNDGATWVNLSNGLPDAVITPLGGLAAISSIAVAPSLTTTIYVGLLRGGVYKSADSGVTWSAANTGVDSDVTAVVVDPSDADRVYAATNNGVYRSTDGGSSWSRRTTGMSERDVKSLAIAPSVATTIYAGTTDGIFVSTNGADDWSTTGSGPSEIISLAVDPFDPLTVYGGTPVGGVFRTANGGTTWTSSGTGIPASSAV